ncbi:MAG: 23S rRNA (guanosine(2251)-2'-O)-methyltransferase RlmB [Pseudomonadota bacterium]
MAQQDLVFGQHAVQSLLQNESERVFEIFVSKARQNSKKQDEKVNSLVNLAKKSGIPVHFCHKKTLDEKSKGHPHQGIVARAKQAPVKTEKDLENLISHVKEAGNTVTLLLLDGITDPHNLGACMRTADAAGVNAVVVPKDKSVALNATVRKVASGAADVLPLIRVTNLARTMRELQDSGIWVIGTAGEAVDNLFDIKSEGHLAIVMGAEDKGMRRLTRETCDQLVKLPVLGSVSSLNVSVATGICLYELNRQRR